MELARTGEGDVVSFHSDLLFSTFISEFYHKPYLRVLLAYRPYQEQLMLFDDDNFEDLYDDGNDFNE